MAVRWIALVGFLMTVCGVAMAAEEADAVVGTWLSAQQDGRIEITKNAAGMYEGRIVWIKEPNFPADDAEAGKPKHDRLNPDPAKRNQPIVGLKLLENFKYAGNNVWKGGTVYDPESGKTYSSKMTLKDPNVLELRGYIGVSLLGRTEKWTRYVPEK